MTNKVEITIIAHDKTDTGFASAKLNATKAGKAYADAYQAEILKGTRGVGAQVSKQVSADMIAGSKGTGEKVSRQFTSGLLAGTKDTGQRVADKFADTVMAKTEGVGEKAGSRFSAEFTRTTKGLGRTTGTDIGVGLATSITAGSKGTGTRVGKQIDEEIVSSTKGTGSKVGKAIDDGIFKDTKSTGAKIIAHLDRAIKIGDAKVIQKTAVASGRAYAEGFGDAVGNVIDFGVKGVGALAGAAGGAAGISIGAAVVGGLSTALIGGGVVGLAGFLLKDNEKVKKAWGDTFKDVTEDAKRRAGFLEDEFIAGAGRVAERWDNTLGPTLERVFKNAEPLVGKFIDMPMNWIDALAPGVEKAVKNAGPAVDGLNNMGTSILKGLGDGLGKLSEHSADAKVAMEMIGEGVGKSLEGALGFIGDLTSKVADNKAAWESWGRGISTVIGGVGTDFKNLVDLAATAGSPNGKNAEGETMGTALEKLLMGDKQYKPPKVGDWNDMRNSAGALDPKNIPKTTVGALSNLYDYGRGKLNAANQAAQPNPIPVSKGSPMFITADALKTAQQFNDSLVSISGQLVDGTMKMQDATVAGGELALAQDALVVKGQALTESSHNNTEANRLYTDAINSMTAAGLPASDSLLSMVVGMNSTELAALGATVRTDGLGNSIISIPGQKDIVVNAATIPAQDAIAAVQGAVNALTGKTVYINVITTGVAAAANSVAGYAAAAAASITGHNKGGIIAGGGPNVDSKLIAATPGEFVVNRRATSENLPLLEAINKGAGGDSVLQMAGGGGRPASSRSASGGGGASPVVVQLNIQPGNYSGQEKQFISWVAEALRTSGGMAVNGWMP